MHEVSIISSVFNIINKAVLKHCYASNECFVTAKTPSQSSSSVWLLWFIDRSMVHLDPALFNWTQRHVLVSLWVKFMRTKLLIKTMSDGLYRFKDLHISGLFSLWNLSLKQFSDDIYIGYLKCVIHGIDGFSRASVKNWCSLSEFLYVILFTVLLDKNMKQKTRIMMRKLVVMLVLFSMSM